MASRFGPGQAIPAPMNDTIASEASGLPLIAAEHASPTEIRPDVRHVTIAIDEDILNPQKSTLSEERFKVAELEKAKMSSVRKRNGMKVTFRVRSDRVIQLQAQRSRYPLTFHLQDLIPSLL